MKLEIKIKNFSLNLTLKSEQCPADLWYYDPYSGYWITYLEILSQWLKILMRQEGQYLIVRYSSEYNLKKNDIVNFINYIFRLDFDLDSFYDEFKDDSYLYTILNDFKGLRLMRDYNKTYRILESIITQNISIKMIKRIQKCLFMNYGERRLVDGELIFTFPLLEKIANETTEGLMNKCRLGYRAKYLRDIARHITRGTLDIQLVSKLPTEQARKYLIGFKGIGEKIADIILIYAFSRDDVFPIDRWIRRAMYNYFNSKKGKVSNREIYQFAKDYFRNFASWVNLYLFAAQRIKNISYFNYCLWK